MVVSKTLANKGRRQSEKESFKMTERKDYTKPEVKKVKLVAEEAVLSNCKTQAIAGPDTTPCRAINIGCLAEGS